MGLFPNSKNNLTHLLKKSPKSFDSFSFLNDFFVIPEKKYPDSVTNEKKKEVVHK